MPSSDIFPTLHYCTKLPRSRWASDSGGVDVSRLYDVKFYPYPTEDNDQIFAVAGKEDVFICRPRLGTEPPNPPCDLLRWFKEEDPEFSVNSLVWTRHPTTGRPVLCVAGAAPKQIRILEVDNGRPLRSIPGHGKGINDLAISPLSTNLVASASEDYTIRLWNLHPNYENQPCVAMFCGEGHKQPILAIHFHPNGRWMLSGGLDTAVCLWSVPSLEELEKTEDEIRNHSEPKIVYYPHFYSTEVHHNYVDCLQFYGDLIVSRACRDQYSKVTMNHILLWKIEGFDPDEPPPAHPPIPSPDVHTRSSFPHPTQSRGFQRLLTFQMPYTDRFYFRFSLLHAPGMRPILCMGNQQSKYFFWDLQRLEEGWNPAEEKKANNKKGRRKRAGVSSDNLDRLGDLRRGESVASDGTGTTGGATPMPSTTSMSTPSDRKFQISDPFDPIKPHIVVTADTQLSKTRHFATSQMAWSPDGTWLVGVGDFGMMSIFHRDKSLVNGVPKIVDGVGAQLKS